MECDYFTSACIIESEDLAEPAAVPHSKLEMSVSDKRSADINQ